MGFEDAWFSWDLTVPVETTLDTNVETLSVMLYVQNTGDTFSASFYSSEGWRNNPYLEVSYTMLESSLTCLLSETSVTYGASVFVSGTLTDTSTEAELSGRTVYLEYSQPEISDWEPLAIVTTGSPYNHTLTLNAGTWQIRATWDGDDNYEGVTTPNITLTEVKASSTVTCTLSEIDVTVGSNLTISGNMDLYLEGEEVILTFTKPDSSTIIRTIIPDSDGFFTYTFTPNDFGSWRVIAIWNGNDNYEGVSSSSKSFTLSKISSNISCSISSSEITIEDSITVSGAIDPTHSSKIVTITYTKSGGSTVMRTVTTESDGSYSNIYIPDADESWSVEASWDGDSTYEGSSSSLTSFTVKKLGCLIATATYGSELSPQVQFLRGFRDNTVLSTFADSNFMRIFNEFYYSFSPNVALIIVDNSPLGDIMKVIFYPLIGILNVGSAIFSVFSVLPELGIILAGLITSALIGIVYFMPIALIFSYFKKYKVSEKKMR